jgi:hypothetical protein
LTILVTFFPLLNYVSIINYLLQSSVCVEQLRPDLSNWTNGIEAIFHGRKESLSKNSVVKKIIMPEITVPVNDVQVCEL